MNLTIHRFKSAIYKYAYKGPIYVAWMVLEYASLLTEDPDVPFTANGREDNEPGDKVCTTKPENKSFPIRTLIYLSANYLTCNCNSHSWLYRVSRSSISTPISRTAPSFTHSTNANTRVDWRFCFRLCFPKFFCWLFLHMRLCLTQTEATLLCMYVCRKLCMCM